MIRKFLTSYYDIIIPFFVFGLVLFSIKPYGDFAVNDDWLFRIQVEAFSKGIWKINSQIDPAFISQGLLGLVWVKLFGVSFTTLKVLNTVLAALCIIVFNKILKFFELNKKQRLFGTLLFISNPLFIVLTPTFMSEISFLFLVLLSLFYYLKGFTKVQHVFNKFVLIGSLFGGFAFLNRQQAIVIPIAFFLTLIIKSLGKKPVLINKTLLFGLFSHVCIYLACFLVWMLWPRVALSGSTGGVTDLLGKLTTLDKLNSRIFVVPFLFVYLGYFLMPLTFDFIAKAKKRVLLFCLLLSIPVAFYIFKYDVFAIGNILYIEGLYIKSNYKVNFSLFDNLFFKMIIAFMVSISTVSLGVIVTKLKFNQGFKTPLFFLVTLTFGFLIISFLGNDLYERYFFMFFVLFSTLLITNINFKPKSFHSYFWVAFLILVTTILMQDYYAHTTVRWQQANKMSSQIDSQTQIYVDDVYHKYAAFKKFDDYSGIRSSQYSQYDYKCYVQNYTIDQQLGYQLILQNTNDYLNKYIDNPRVHDSRKPTGIPKIKNNLDKLELNDAYYSILYNIVGKPSFVGTFCP